MIRPKVTVVFGGQTGSEGKGVIVAKLAMSHDVHVRVGAPNAGHTFVHTDGKSYKMQTIPVGWTNPNAILIIGRGGLVDPKLLREEIEMVAQVDPTIHRRLFIDIKCGVLDACFHQFEGGVNGEMHARIGSTGEGVGPAREARIKRDPKAFRLFGDLAASDPFFERYATTDTPDIIHNLRREGATVLLEGAQGQGLSLIHGPWPYCTSTDPGPAQLAADVGIPPTELGRVIACMRTFPIRVAGTSGPMENEITWEQLSKELGREIQERTTVTRKIRRVGRWDHSLARSCRIIHQPNEIALTFVDYLGLENEGVTSFDSLSDIAKGFIREVEDEMQAPVTLISTGPNTVITRDSKVLQ